MAKSAKAAYTPDSKKLAGWQAEWVKADGKSADESLIRAKVIREMIADGAAKGDVAEVFKVSAGNVSHWLSTAELLESFGINLRSKAAAKSEAFRSAYRVAKSMGDARTAVGLVKAENGKPDASKGPADIVKAAAEQAGKPADEANAAVVLGDLARKAEDERVKRTEGNRADSKSASVRGEGLIRSLQSAREEAQKVGEVSRETSLKITELLSELGEMVAGFPVDQGAPARVAK